MEPTGNQLRWLNGKIMHPLSNWKSPSKRRLPRLLIEDRALEVGIKITLEGEWIVFAETDLPVEKIRIDNGEELEFYQVRYHLLPKKFKRQDTLEWLQKEGNALILFGKDNKFYIKSAKD